VSGFFKKGPKDKRPQGRPLKGLVDGEATSRLMGVKFPKKESKAEDLIDLPIGAFRTALRERITPESPDLLAVVLHANTLSDRSKPSDSWLRKGESKVDNLGHAKLEGLCIGWLSSFQPNPENPDASLRTLQGLIWLCCNSKSDALTQAIRRYAMVCFSKLAKYGPRSTKMGNVCIAVLESMARNCNDLAISELIVIRQKSIYPSVRKAANIAITKVANHRDVSLQTLEDNCLPDFDFNGDGKIFREIDGYQAELALRDSNVHISWSDPNGKSLKAMPRALAKSHADETKAINYLRKSINDLLSTQLAALEATFLTRRVWAFEYWRCQFLGHPLRRRIVENLVWCTEAGPSQAIFIPRGDELLGLYGEKVTVAEKELLTLWHPLYSDHSTREALHSLAQDIDLVEPFSQLTRRTFLLEPLEWETHNYSNRFAAHVLNHHQFSAICKKMDWIYKIEGLRDWSPSCARKYFPHWNIRADFAVVPVIQRTERRAMQNPSQATTDRLTFFDDAGESLALEDIDSIALSEIMYEVDGLLDITSKADNLTWADRGPRT